METTTETTTQQIKMIDQGGEKINITCRPTGKGCEVSWNTPGNEFRWNVREFGTFGEGMKRVNERVKAFTKKGFVTR